MMMIPEVYAQETPRNERILSLLSAVLLRDHHHGFGRNNKNIFHAAIQNSLVDSLDLLPVQQQAQQRCTVVIVILSKEEDTDKSLSRRNIGQSAVLMPSWLNHLQETLLYPPRSQGIRLIPLFLSNQQDMTLELERCLQTFHPETAVFLLLAMPPTANVSSILMESLLSTKKDSSPILHARVKGMVSFQSTDSSVASLIWYSIAPSVPHLVIQRNESTCYRLLSTGNNLTVARMNPHILLVLFSPLPASISNNDQQRHQESNCNENFNLWMTRTILKFMRATMQTLPGGGDHDEQWPSPPPLQSSRL
jgi:hypothetical protein